jgi:hypothetical protein
MTNPLPARPWVDQRRDWPDTGRVLLAHHDPTTVVVYQAYRPEIAEHAVRYQRFGGPFSLDRMSWVKPGFLWMMYRSGWASKPGQERVLAVRLPRPAFESILAAAVPSGFDAARYSDRAAWRAATRESDIRVQWDPDHDPHGRPLARRVIQLGLRREVLRRYARDWPVEIRDITDFVAEQRDLVACLELEKLLIPIETAYPFVEREPGPVPAS